MIKELQRINAQEGLSKDVGEIVGKILNEKIKARLLTLLSFGNKDR